MVILNLSFVLSCVATVWFYGIPMSWPIIFAYMVFKYDFTLYRLVLSLFLSVLASLVWPLVLIYKVWVITHD